jgi:DNA repair protein SbcC/Rad50
MIPQRIALRGFLSYREEQEILFDSGSLWLLAGLNGSGKSAVFDAITYALFGGHRGGQTGAQGLINKDSNNLVVEFDFLLDEKFYQARRTLRVTDKGKTTATQQVRRWEVPADETGRWETVPDTTNRAGFDAWVRDNIGLTYETFTSSVLLMQGKAEKLLSAAPKERFEVLAGIVDLDRYQNLHKRADERRKAAELKAETLQQRLNALPEVSEAEIAEAEKREAAAQAAWQEIQEQVVKLQRLEFLAERWAGLQKDVAENEERWQRYQTLLGEAESIERDAQRLRELQQVLPLFESALVQQNRLRQAEQAMIRLREEHRRLSERLVTLDAALEQVDQKRHRQEQAQLAEAERSQTVTVEMQTLSLAMVHLRRLHRERQALLEARLRTDKADVEERQSAEALEQRQREMDRCHGDWAAAQQERQTADHRLTQARTLFEAAEERRQRFFSVVGEKRCRYCGQALTAAHVEEEKAKLEAEVAAAEDAYRDAEQVQQQAVCVEARQAELRQTAESALQDVRLRQTQWQRLREEALHEVDRHVCECEAAHRELAEPYRSRVTPAAAVDWLAAVYPTAEELEELQARLSQLSEEARILQTERERRRVESVEAAAEAQRLDAERRGVQQHKSEHERRLTEETLRQGVCQENLSQITRTLPDAWRKRVDKTTLAEDVKKWRSEREQLEAGGVAQRFQELAQVRAEFEPLRIGREALARQQEEIPAEARCAPAALRGQLEAVRHTEKLRDQERTAAQHARQQLQQLQNQRHKLLAESRKADRDQQLHELLAKLLGRDRLQLHLVRQAERSIVDQANAVLDRVSGGQLYLRLQPGEDGESGADHALQLQAYNRSTGSLPINVAFLSGSQRFRVAVSLALGIGQYASRRHRPIESVIIDEGFGCLDRQGRQVMIQELHNLKDHLRCICVVSHQEEFADAFADGYRFELVDGSTVATRFQN